MRILMLVITLLAINPLYAKSLLDKKNCTFNGISLKGDVKIVDVFADIKIKKVDAFADIDVKLNGNPSKCGEWRIVDAFPDFTVQYVDALEDIKVREVDAFPGMN